MQATLEACSEGSKAGEPSALTRRLLGQPSRRAARLRCRRSESGTYHAGGCRPADVIALRRSPARHALRQVLFCPCPGLLDCPTVGGCGKAVLGLCVDDATVSRVTGAVEHTGPLLMAGCQVRRNYRPISRRYDYVVLGQGRKASSPMACRRAASSTGSGTGMSSKSGVAWAGFRSVSQRQDFTRYGIAMVRASRYR